MSTLPSDARLVGTTVWRPTGESALTVIEKLRLLNHLSDAELGRLFGTRGAETFSSSLRAESDLTSLLRVPKITQLARWHDDAMSASFELFYRVPYSDTAVSDSRFLHVRRSLRLCASCASMGVHLVVHQCDAFVRCPVHRERLSNLCPECGERLAAYKYITGRTHSMACSACEWKAWTKVPPVDLALQEMQRTFVDSFSAWMDEIASASSGQSRWRLLGRARRLKELANINAIVPGPDWVRDCVRNASVVRVSDSILPIPPGVTDTLFVALDDEKKAKMRLRPCERLNAILSRRVEVLYDARAPSLDQQYVRQYRLDDKAEGVQITPYGYSLLYSEYTSIAALALHWWRRCVSGTIYPGEKIHVRHAFSKVNADGETPIGSLPFWCQWLTGPGRLYSLDLGSRGASKVDAGADRIARRWLNLTLEQLFLSLIGRASIITESRVRPDSILEEACDVGDLSTVAICQDSGGVSLRQVSTLAPASDFVTLFRSGYKGPDVTSKRPVEQDYLVHDLLRLSCERRERSAEKLAALRSSKVLQRASKEHNARAVHDQLEKARCKPDSEIEADLGVNQEGPAVRSDDHSLGILDRNDDVTCTQIESGKWRVEYQNRKWFLYPTAGLWREIDNLGEAMPEIYHGSVADFNLSCIVRPRHLPPNTSRRWSESEKGRLRVHIENNGLLADAARELGRSPRSVAMKAGMLLGLDFGQVLTEVHLADLHFANLIERGLPSGNGLARIEI